jgi:hypothetical protein
MLNYDEAGHTETFEEALGMMVVEVPWQLHARSTFVLVNHVESDKVKIN